VPSERTCVERPASLIPGVYKYCDDWCGYCPVTARCLSFRVRQERRARNGTDGSGDIRDAVAFTKEVAAAAGETTPELDAVLAGDPQREYEPAPDDVWLVVAARVYAGAAGRFLLRSEWVPNLSDHPVGPPSPLDVVAWNHLLLAVRTGRALFSMARADRGCVGALEDARGCAKIALVAIERSTAAFRALASAGEAHTVRPLASMLKPVAAGLEARIPGARSVIRPGLDAPVV
jgi:hypothetical protein